MTPDRELTIPEIIEATRQIMAETAAAFREAADLIDPDNKESVQ